MDGWIHICMYVCMYGWVDGWMDGWMDGWRMDGWMDGRWTFNENVKMGLRLYLIYFTSSLGHLVTKQTYIRDIYFTMTAEWSLKLLYWIIRIWQLMEVCLVTISQHFGYTYIMFSSAQKYKICRIKNILAFLRCKTCLLCIFMSKSSSNTMGVQLFNVLFIKVGGTRPVTGFNCPVKC